MPRRPLRILTAVAASALTLIALAALGQSLSGRRALTNLENEIRSAGAKWSFADYGMAPAEVRGERFDDWLAAVDHLAKITDETTPVVGSISRHHSELGSEPSLLVGTPQDHRINDRLTWPEAHAAYAPVREAFNACVALAATRDISFRPAYDLGVTARFPQLPPMLTFARIGNQLVQLDLVTSGPETALETAEQVQATLAACRPGGALSFIELLVITHLRQSFLQSFRTILLAPNLSPASLDRLEALLPADSLRDHLQTALEGERALNLLWIHDQLRRARWSDLTTLSTSMTHPWVTGLSLAFYRPLFLDADTAHTGRLLWNEEQRLRLLTEGGLSVPQSFAQNPSPENALPAGSFPPRLLAHFLSPAVEPIFRHTFFGEARERQAQIALALKRHHQTHRTYPETLNELERITTRALHDPVTSEPMRYRREAEDAYTLYSVGWNGTDDGGRVQPRKKPDGDGTPSELRADDWLWPRPSNLTPPTTAKNPAQGKPASAQPAPP